MSESKMNISCGTMGSAFNMTCCIERNSSEAFCAPSDKLKAYYVTLLNDVIFQETLLPSMIYLIILLLIGLPGNILVCYIYHTDEEMTHTVNHNTGSKLNSSTIFILALAWMDVINCLVSLPTEIFLLRNFLKFDHPYICKVSRYLAMVLNAASSVVLIGIALDRFIALKIKRPRHHFTGTTAKKIVAVSVIFALLVSLPSVVLYGTQTVPLVPGIEGKTCLIDDEFVDTRYPLIHTAFLLSTHILCDILFIIVYGSIGRKIIKHGPSFRQTSNKYKDAHYEKKHQRVCSVSSIENCQYSSASHLDDNRNVLNKPSHEKYSNYDENNGDAHLHVTCLKSNQTIKNKVYLSSEAAIHGRIYTTGKTAFMLFIVTIVFMLTFAPYCVIAILRNTMPDDFYRNLSNTEKIFYQLFLRSYLLSSAGNPIIYSFLSVRFRQQCKLKITKLFKC